MRECEVSEASCRGGRGQLTAECTPEPEAGAAAAAHVHPHSKLRLYGGFFYVRQIDVIDIGRCRRIAYCDI